MLTPKYYSSLSLQVEFCYSQYGMNVFQQIYYMHFTFMVFLSYESSDGWQEMNSD